jgi:hypothetical protein
MEGSRGSVVFSEITGAAIGTNPVSAKVQADGKTVILTLGTPIDQKTTFTTTQLFLIQTALSQLDLMKHLLLLQF